MQWDETRQETERLKDGINSSEPLVSEALAREHGLSAEEWGRILKALGRKPSYTELGIFSVMWSEHCSYKSSRRYLKTLPTTGPTVLQGPGENAGIVDIGEGYGIAFKMESHNHPSFIEPYQGAATGVGGILRDVFTMGARPIANLNSLRFGAPDHPKTKYLLSRVVAGIGGYGNCIGVPTVGGEVFFHPSYNGNILVNAFTAGLVRTDKIFRAKATGVGNPVMYVGSKTGRDGIHGATMASEEFGSGGEERRPTVQVGDPFTEKLLLEACMELFSKDSVVAIQDMGAAGLTSSSVEMAARGGMGIEMDLDSVPRREEGMTPYEIMLSESQERMLLVAKAGREREVEAIFQKWDLDVAVVGRITDTRRIVIKSGGKTYVDLPLEPLADAPLADRPTKRPSWQDEVQKLDEDLIAQPKDYMEALLRLLSSPNIASKRSIFEQYDHLVGNQTLVLPGSDAAVLRILGTKKAVALSADCNSRHCYLDPYGGAVAAVAECARNLSASGALPLGATDCLNFGSPERPEIEWQFAECVRGLSDACRALGIPIVSGNVSFYNETSGSAVYPTPTVAMVGLIEDAARHCDQYFKKAGDLIVLLGRNVESLGGSEYLSALHGKDQGKPPAVDLTLEKSVQKTCREAVARGLLQSAHDCSDGGLAVTVVESCFDPLRKERGEGFLGAEIQIEDYMRSDALLFAEAPSRIVVSVRGQEALEALVEIARANQTPCLPIGEVIDRMYKFNGLVVADVKDLEAAWSGGLQKAVG